MLISIAICDDNPQDIQIVQKYLSAFEQKHPEFPLISATFTSALDLLEAIDNNGGFDLYVLDIIMPHMLGIDAAYKIRRLNASAGFLFLSSSREYAVEAFKIKSCGYLLKPIKQDEFYCELLNFLTKFSPKDNPSILIKDSETVHKVHINDLVMIESFNHMRRCTLSDGTYIETYATLSSLFEQLQIYPSFFIPHRSYIINLDYVTGLTATELVIANGRCVPVSRNTYPRLRKAYMDYNF